MSDSLLTRCPHCDTTFRITQAHLQIAGGAVRCGACYQVFHAGEHIVAAEPEPVDAGLDDTFDMDEAPATRHTRQPSSSLRADDPDDFHLEDFDVGDDTSLPDLTEDDDDLMHAPPRAEPKSTAPSRSASSAKPVDESDPEHWAKALLLELGEPIEDDEDDTPPPRKQAARPARSAADYEDGLSLPATPAEHHAVGLGDELTDSFKKVGVQEHHDHFRLDQEEIPEEDPEGWAKAMVAEMTPVPPRAPPPKPKAAPASEPDFHNIESLDLDLPDAPPMKAGTIETIELSDLTGVMPTLELIRDEPLKNERFLPEGTSRHRAIPSTTPRPKAVTPRRSRVGLWAGGAAALVLIAVGLLATLNFDQWARKPAYRGLYGVACGMLGCTLPSPSDTTRIHASKLIVRTHPTIPNALLVNTTMVNEADYPQPFPLFELTFEDINGKVVASRAFTPTEYIKASGVDFKHMPPRTPFIVGLEIQDPGKSANSYHVRFLPVPE